MKKGTPRIFLELKPVRLAAIIDHAVVASSEVVNFHLGKMADANFDEPAQAENLRYRFSTPPIGADERKAMHENWILAKAFQEVLRAVRHSLEEAYVYLELLTNEHRVKSRSSLSDFLKPFISRAAGLKFPKLLDAVNNKLEPKIEFAQAYRSLQKARNCLEHRGGIVSEIDTHNEPHLELIVPGLKLFYMRGATEVELEIGQRVDAGDGQPDVQVLMKLGMKKRKFELGQRITFSAAEFNEIAFACHFLGQQLATRLPKPEHN